MDIYRCIIQNKVPVPPRAGHAPVSCKANRDRNKLGAWLDSDRIYE